MEPHFPPADEAALRRYLLGELPEQELESIEKRLFSEEDCWEHLALVEDDLIDEYVRDELPRDDRERFESHFLASPRRAERVALARGWLDAAPSLQTAATRSRVLEFTNRSTDRRPARAVWERVFGAPAALPVAAGLLLLAGGTTVVWLNQRLAGQREQSAALRQQIDVLRAEVKSGRDALAEQPAPAPAQPVQIVAPFSFLLMPGAQRDASQAPQILRIPEGRYSVELQLALSDARRFASYRAVIQNLDGVEVWGAGQLSASTGAGGLALKLVAPSAALRDGDYRLLISGVRASGEVDELDNYYVFHVTRN